MFYFDKFLDKTVLKSDFLKNCTHFFTTKEFILKTKENPQLEQFNRGKLKEVLGLDLLVSPEQRHTANIEHVSLDKVNYPEVDALILKPFQSKRVGVFLNFADCTPVILYDKVQNIAAIAHAGWRGTVQEICKKTVLKMNSKPENIIGLIGPCICFDCFETSEEIALMLAKTVKNPDSYIKKNEDKFYADLKGINKSQLLETGVKNIDIAPFCTCCDNDKFFSYRKENKTTNRMSAFVFLN